MSAMERFKASKFVPTNWRSAITDSSDARRSPSPVVEAPLGTLPQNANMGNLGASNAALGASDGDYLHIMLTSLGNSALLEALSTGAQRLSELRHVTLTTPSKRETTIDRLPLKVNMSQDEDWQALYEAADNPTRWYRQPLVIVVLICSESVEDYKTRFRKRLLELRDKLAALPAGVTTRLAIACVRSATTQSPEAFRKVHTKVQDDFHRTDRVLRLDAGIENMQSTRSTRDWDALKQLILLRFSEAFEQRMEAYGEELRSLRAGLDGSVAHLAHNLLVKDALVTMLSRARLYADAAMEMTYMDISYEAHLERHPAMHVFAVTLDSDLNPSLHDMRQEFLRRMVVQDGRMNVFVMREYLYGMRLRLMRETTREAGLSADSLTCAQQALTFLASARAKLHQLQRDGGVPYLFPECWICLASLGIASVLVETLNAAAEATGGSGGVTGPSALRSKPSILGGDKTAEALRLSASELMYGTPDSLHALLPPAVAVSVTQLLETLSASQQPVVEDSGVATGVGAQDNTARLAPASPSRLPELDAAQMLRKMHLVVAQALSNAYLAAVEMSESLALSCPLHPTATDVAPMTSWFAGRKHNGAAAQPETWISAKQTAPEPDSMSLSVQLFTTASHGTLRESEIIVPFELVHLPGSGSVPSWLSNSALAPFVSDAVQLEHLLRVVACSASHRFLLAGARRHGTCLASLAACYFFRMDEPEPAARLWLAAVVPLMQQGWHRAAVRLLDRLLAAGCLLRADFTAAAAVQLLSMPPSTIAAALPGDEMIPRLMHACALRALQNFSPPADISLQEALFLDVSKSRASRFYEEVAANGEPVLRPAAGAEGAAQLVGLADHVTMRVCITSKLPLPVKVSNLTVQLQHVIHTPKKKLAAGQWLAGPTAGAPSTTAADCASSASPLDSTPSNTVLDSQSQAGLTALDDRASSAPSRRSHRSHHRAKSRFGGGADGGGSKGGGTSGAGYAASLFSDAPIAGRAADSAFEHSHRMRDWSAGYILDCPLEEASGIVELRPGDNMVHFAACPLQEGLHLLDCVYGTMECAAQHSLVIEARCGGSNMSLSTGGFSEPEPFGAALLVHPDEDNLNICTVVPGGVLLESQSQWLGVRLMRARGEVRDVIVRVALRAVDRAAPLEFATVASTLSAASTPASRRSATGRTGPGVVQGATGGGGAAPDSGFWQRSGVNTVDEVLCHEGEIALRGLLGEGGTLWLPVCCRQQHALMQLVDIGAGAMLTGDQGDRPHEESLDAAVEITVSYWSGCWRSKHMRLRLPVQRCVSTTVTAQSVGAAELAVQVTQASLCPCSIVFNSLQLQLQAGLAHSTRSVAGMEPPFRIAPSSAHSFLFFVDHSAASGAARAVLQSCRLTSSYVILRDDLENLELVVLDATGRVVPPHKQSGSFNTNTAVSSSAVQTPQKQKKGGGGADEAGGDNKLPQALANTVLYVPDPTEPVNGSMKSARSGEGHVVAVPGDDVGVVAASCVHSHIFRLELPSFSFTAHQSGEADGVGSPVCGAPVIHFIGPLRACAGRPVLLVWKVAWPSADGHDDPLDSGDEGVQSLQYEVLMPGGWQRGRKQKGIVKLGTAGTSFATVAISAVPVSGGRVATPTLIVLPPQQQPVRGGSVWMDVAELR